jgi:hypothetical protein
MSASYHPNVNSSFQFIWALGSVPCSVLGSGSVRFSAPKMGNRQPQPVQPVTPIGKTATEPLRTGPHRFGCGPTPVLTG